MFGVPVEREGGITVERMTEWGPNGYFVRPDKGGATLVYSPGNEPAQRFEGSIVDRLAGYENIGYTPEQLLDIIRGRDIIRVVSPAEIEEAIEAGYRKALNEVYNGEA